jgi:hypothetical protein
MRLLDFSQTGGTGHDLAELADRCATEGTALPLAEIDQLTPFGVRLRYGEFDDMVPVARGLALGWAERTIAWARDVLDGAN